jgi:hypothetical protein
VNFASNSSSEDNDFQSIVSIDVDQTRTNPKSEKTFVQRANIILRNIKPISGEVSFILSRTKKGIPILIHAQLVNTRTLGTFLAGDLV